MTPKEKALELVDKFDKAVNTHTNRPLKKCALIAVEEILKLDIYKSDQWYWEEVKEEIEKL